MGVAQSEYLATAFQSTPSVGRATKSLGSAVTEAIFQSTPSVGRATAVAWTKTAARVFQSTPSVGRATGRLQDMIHDWIISIHALRGEGDFDFLFFGRVHFGISIHALRGEGDKLPA